MSRCPLPTPPTTPRAAGRSGLHKLGAALLLGAGMAPGAASAQATPEGRALADSGAATASAAAAGTRAEPQVLQRVLEGEHIVIEELVVRGQPVRISVRGKSPGARGYEINVGPGGRDASQDSGRAGQSAWRLFSF